MVQLSLEMLVLLLLVRGCGWSRDTGAGRTRLCLRRLAGPFSLCTCPAARISAGDKWLLSAPPAGIKAWGQEGFLALKQG